MGRLNRHCVEVAAPQIYVMFKQVLPILSDLGNCHRGVTDLPASVGTFQLRSSNVVDPLWSPA